MNWSYEWVESVPFNHSPHYSPGTERKEGVTSLLLMLYREHSTTMN
jgi:hypothetical protein